MLPSLGRLSINDIIKSTTIVSIDSHRGYGGIGSIVTTTIMTSLLLTSFLMHGHLLADFELDSSGSMELEAKGSGTKVGPTSGEVGVMVAMTDSKAQ